MMRAIDIVEAVVVGSGSVRGRLRLHEHEFLQRTADIERSVEELGHLLEGG